jgi:hypothetical protein
MCVLGIGAALASAIGGAGAATAAGAGAAAATAGAGLTVGGILQGVGAVAGLAGALYQNRLTNDYAKAQTAAIEAQASTEAQLTATEDQRRRQTFTRAIRHQTAELAARGVSLDSPTAILLGQTAAQELSFESQAVRAAGQATQQELKGRVAAVQTTAKADRLKTTTGAVASVLQSGRTIWPGLADARIGGRVLS